MSCILSHGKWNNSIYIPGIYAPLFLAEEHYARFVRAFTSKFKCVLHYRITPTRATY